MTPKRAHILMFGLLVIPLILLVAATFEVNSLMQTQSIKLTNLKAKLASIKQLQTSLSVDKKEIATYSNLYNIARVVVPENKDQVQTVRQIVNLAANNNVLLDSITFPSSSLGNNVARPSGTAAAPTAAQSAGASGNPSLSQLVAVPNIPGVYQLPITIQSAPEAGKEATYPELISFLQALENNRQTALVSTINILPNQSNNSYISFTILMNIYIKPGN